MPLEAFKRLRLRLEDSPMWRLEGNAAAARDRRRTDLKHAGIGDRLRCSQTHCPWDAFVRAEARRLPGYFDILIIFAMFVAVCGPYLRQVLQSAIPGGWDGIAHYGILQVYAREIFPRISGWVPEYFAGMPFPNFYPPLLYWLVAIPIRLGVDPATALLSFQIFIIATIPVLTYAVSRRLSESRIGGLTSALVSIWFLADNSRFRGFGVTLSATFDSGLASQVLGYWFVLALLYFLLGADRYRRDATGATICLAAVALTNVHTIWPAAILVMSFGIVHLFAQEPMRQRAWRSVSYVLIALIALLLSACWVLPMLVKLMYAPTVAFEPPALGAVVYAFSRLSIYVVLALIVALVRKDKKAIGLVAALLAMVGVVVFPWAKVPGLTDLAVQPARILICAMMLVPLLAGYLVGTVPLVSQVWWAQPVVATLSVALFLAHANLVVTFEGGVSTEMAAAYNNVLRQLSGRADGRVVVVMGQGSISEVFGMQSLVGASGSHSITTVFRESSLNVYAATSLRNIFSETPEVFGVDDKSNAEELAADPWEMQLARLRLFNARYLVARSDKTKARLSRPLECIGRVAPGHGSFTYLTKNPRGSQLFQLMNLS